MPKAEILVDFYRYHETTGDPSSAIVEVAREDGPIDVSADELERGVAAGALKKAGSSGGGQSDPWKDVTVEKMDAYAGANSVADYDPSAKKTEKVKALEAAGVAPNQVSDFQPTV